MCRLAHIYRQKKKQHKRKENHRGQQQYQKRPCKILPAYFIANYFTKMIFLHLILSFVILLGTSHTFLSIIPQFCKHFKLGSPNLSKALLHLQLCKYFLNEKFFEMLRKVCGGSNPATGQKNPEMHLQNFEKLQSRKKRRNLSKSPLFSFFRACI